VSPPAPAPDDPRLRVALLGPAYPLRGGMSQFLAFVHRALEPHAEVRQFSFSRQYPGFLFPGRTQHDVSEAPLRVPAEPVLDAVAPWQWPAAARRVAAWRPDALVVNWWLPFFGPAYSVVMSAARRAGAVTLLLAHNLLPHERRPLDGLFTRLVLARTDGYLVASEAVEKELLTLVPGARFRRLLHPVYEQYATGETRAAARAALGLEGDVLLFFGFVRPYKGLDTLLDAMPAILAARPATLIVAGEFYEPVEPYRRRIAALGIGERVRLLDRYVPDEEARRLLAAADVCVLPYRAATQSGVLQVAYGAGCPVIATRAGGLPEFVAEGVSGLLVPPDDPAALARAALEFFGAGGRAAFEPRVREYARRFSWDAFALGLLDLARELRAARRTER
jgi:glycosyltransferase involved in cell wall biosynthesis